MCARIPFSWVLVWRWMGLAGHLRRNTVLCSLGGDDGVVRGLWRIGRGKLRKRWRRPGRREAATDKWLTGADWASFCLRRSLCEERRRRGDQHRTRGSVSYPWTACLALCIALTVVLRRTDLDDGLGISSNDVTHCWLDLGLEPVRTQCVAPPRARRRPSWADATDVEPQLREDTTRALPEPGYHPAGHARSSLRRRSSRLRRVVTALVRWAGPFPVPA